MADFTITDLDNLPAGATINETANTRAGNVITYNNIRGSFTLNFGSEDYLFKAGTDLQFAFDVNEWSQRYLRVYCRGRIGWNDFPTTGNAEWSRVEGMVTADSSNPIGQDANIGVRRGSPGTVILQFKFVHDCHGFQINIGSINSDGTTGNGTGKYTLKYFTTKITPVDPYKPDGETVPDGGEGDFDDIIDPVPFPPLPGLSAVDTKFITLFNPTLTELQNLAGFMWSSGFDIATLKKLFTDPMQCILGLSIVPVAVPDGGQTTVTVGNVSTGVTMTKAASQYVTIDCGTLNVQEHWGAYLDYDPYTKAEIYLPYCGIHALSVDDIMGKAVQVKYNIDILSGACCAMVKCGQSVLYSFIGQCAASIPITGNDWTNVINGVISAAVSIGSMAATGGASAYMSIPNMAQTAVNGMSTKPSIEKSGAMGGTGGMLAIQTPYLILTRPRQALPRDQNLYMGYPSFITYKLSELEGYTEIESIHLEGVPATDAELREIEELLKGGVIF